MKNYKFSLESVLEVRSNEEQNVLEDFVIVQNCLVEADNKRLRLSNEFKLCLEKSILTRNVQDLVMQNFYKMDLENKIKNQELVVEEKKVELESVRERLQIAQRDKKIMEKLKEKDLDEYKTDLLKKEQKEIDEFAVLRFKQA